MTLPEFWETARNPSWRTCALHRPLLHVLGACEAGASIRENVHQMRRARSCRSQSGGPLEAALSAVQVRERADLSPGQIIRRLTAIAPKTVRGRARTPALLRNHAKLAVDAVDFCRALAGRGHRAGLLTTIVPF